MFENTGITPAEQDTVETVDTVESIVHSTNQTYMAELEAKVANLENQLAKVKADRDYYSNVATKRWDTIEQAREAIQEVLAGDVNPQSTFDDFRTAFELLGVTLTREVEVEITVTWRGTMTLPTGVDPEDLDIDDFGIEISGHYEWESNFDGMHDYRISER